MPKKKTKKTKNSSVFNLRRKKHNKRDIIALILSLIAVSFFILYAVYFLAEKSTLISMLNNPNYPELNAAWPIIIPILSVVWIIFAVAMSLVIYKIEKKQAKWHSLLIISIVSLLTLRIDSFILGLIASILYMKHHR